VSGSDEETDVVIIIGHRFPPNRLDQREPEDRNDKRERFQNCHSHRRRAGRAKRSPPLERSP